MDHLAENINNLRSSSESRAASFSYGLLEIGTKQIKSVLLDSKTKRFYRFDSTSLPTNQEQLEANNYGSQLNQRFADVERLYLGYDYWAASFYPNSFSKSQIESVSNQLSGLPEAKPGTLHLQELYTLNLTIAFHLPEFWQKLVVAYLPQARVLHSKSGWLIRCSFEAQKTKHLIGISIDNGRFSLTVFSDSHLQLFNTFACQSATDIAYYTLYTLQQLEVPAEQTQVLLTGAKTECKALSSVISPYIGTLRHFQLESDLSSEQNPIGEYGSLSQLYLCE